MVTRYTGGTPVVEMSWEKILEFTTFFVFWTILSNTLVPWSPLATRYTGGLSPIKPSGLNIFYFLDNFIRHTGPMVTRYTGGLSQHPVVK